MEQNITLNAIITPKFNAYEYIGFIFDNYVLGNLEYDWEQNLKLFKKLVLEHENSGNLKYSFVLNDALVRVFNLHLSTQTRKLWEQTITHLPLVYGGWTGDDNDGCDDDDCFSNYRGWVIEHIMDTFEPDWELGLEIYPECECKKIEPENTNEDLEVKE